MKIGLIGLPQTGKNTLFWLLTGHRPSENEIVSGKPVVSIAEIKDKRFDVLAQMYKPKKTVRARIELVLLPRLEKDSLAKGDWFKDITELDAVCHVVRAFKDDSVYHISGFVDPKRDIDTVNSELILSDLIFIEKRMERLEKKIKQIKEDAAIKEKDILLKLKSALDREEPLRLLGLTAEEIKTISGYPFLTRTAMMIVLNVSDDELKKGELIERLKKDYSRLNIRMMQVSAKVEAEIAAFDSDAERKEFLTAMGIEESAVEGLTRLCIAALDRISFFTVGPDEVRQWIIPRGSSAPRAAGAIHSDIEKGFIRAETMKYADLAELGSEEKVKSAGKYYIKGRDYIVEDGDILNIRFSV